MHQLEAFEMPAMPANLDIVKLFKRPRPRSTTARDEAVKCLETYKKYLTRTLRDTLSSVYRAVIGG
jgi:hypothetical protein